MNIAIIGCGRVAGHHCNSIKMTSRLKLVAVCDLNLNRARLLGLKYNVEYFDNYIKMLSTLSKKIDIVAIITPSGMHYTHAMDVMKRFKKHIIVEKPTFMKPSEVKLAYNYSKKYNLKIFPVFQNRYNLAVKRVKRAIENNELGKINIVNVRVRWCRPQRYYDLSEWRGTFSHDGGALTNQGIHHVDLLRYLVGEVEEVFCLMNTFGAKIEVEDSAVATVKYKSGTIGTLEVTTSARPDDFEASISLVGDKGLAQIGGVAVNELQIFTPNPPDCIKYSDKYSDLDEIGKVYGRGHHDIYKFIKLNFYSKIKYPVNDKDCYKTIKLLHSFYKSNEVKKTIKLLSKFESNYLGRKNNKITKLYITKNNSE
tara:strand:- start:241 stop:1344 length:1104 start_codon:yes stop_codon:yes gene_type:complete